MRIISPLRIIPPRRLVLSGGGIRTMTYMGVLQVLEERRLLQGIREFCGVSAGALIALLLALGYSLSSLEKFFLEYDFSQIRSLDPETSMNFFETYGLDTGEKVVQLLEKFLAHKGFQPSVTFQDLAASGRCKRFRLWASDLQMLKPVEFSAEATPDISVTLALRASISIPLYFTPVRHPTTGHLLVDGGSFDNYPIAFLSPAEQEESLGITFEFGSLPKPIDDFPGFLSMLTTGYYIPSYQQLLAQHHCRTIRIPCYEVSSHHFEASQEEKRALMDMGRTAAELFFQTTRYSGRRHSVS